MLRIWLNTLAFALIFITGISGMEDQNQKPDAEVAAAEQGASKSHSMSFEKAMKSWPELPMKLFEVADSDRAGRPSQQSEEITKSFQYIMARAEDAKKAQRAHSDPIVKYLSDHQKTPDHIKKENELFELLKKQYSEDSAKNQIDQYGAKQMVLEKQKLFEKIAAEQHKMRLRKPHIYSAENPGNQIAEPFVRSRVSSAPAAAGELPKHVTYSFGHSSSPFVWPPMGLFENAQQHFGQYYQYPHQSTSFSQTSNIPGHFSQQPQLGEHRQFALEHQQKNLNPKSALGYIGDRRHLYASKLVSPSSSSSSSSTQHGFKPHSGSPFPHSGLMREPLRISNLSRSQSPSPSPSSVGSSGSSPQAPRTLAQKFTLNPQALEWSPAGTPKSVANPNAMALNLTAQNPVEGAVANTFPSSQVYANEAARKEEADMQNLHETKIKKNDDLDEEDIVFKPKFPAAMSSTAVNVDKP